MSLFDYKLYKFLKSRTLPDGGGYYYCRAYKNEYLECRKESQERWNKRKFNRLLNSSLVIKEEIKKKSKI